MAICVRVWEWSETSQTVCVLTREHGLVRGLAKGSRRPKAAFSGGFEPITRGEIGLITKPGRELAIVTHWDLTWVLAEARRSLDVFYGGLYAADLAGRLIQDHDPHPGLYGALSDCLARLPLGVDSAVLGFQWAALDETGHRPELWADVRTGEAIELAEVMGFDPHLGGLVSDPGSGSNASVWRVRGETIGLLRALARSEKGHTGDDSRAARLLHAYSSYLIGKPIASGNALWGPLDGLVGAGDERATARGLRRSFR